MMRYNSVRRRKPAFPDVFRLEAAPKPDIVDQISQE